MLSISRRNFLAGLSAVSIVGGSTTGRAGTIRTRTIPSSGEPLPVIGMGTWITLNVGNDPRLRAGRVEVLRTFFQMGGGMIDSSPMYGSAEAVIGHCFKKLGRPKGLFSATKVWTPLTSHGVTQIANSKRLWGLTHFDLFQIHNLVNWEGHLAVLRERQEAGLFRYLGITTSHGGRHLEMLKIIAAEKLDFAQFTYNIVDREAEARLIPAAADHGLAVIANRPFRCGALIDEVSRYPLPSWASEFNCSNWAQFLLKFILSNPAITCVIPATSRVDHMQENMGAGFGQLPNMKTRLRMIRYVENL